MKPHKHAQSRLCICDLQGLEPDEKCPRHGVAWPPRCEICGQMMKWDIKYERETQP
jgi:hypothetical protein